MHNNKCEYGPISRAIYMALLCLTLVVSLAGAVYLMYFVGFLLFLSFGLRPLLEKSGVVDLFMHATVTTEQAIHRKSKTLLRQKIDRQVRDEKFRKMC